MLVSIVILNYNGKEFLRRTVESALALSWTEREVIIVDNASVDGSAEEIEREFRTQVRVIKRTVNSATAGRNDGFRAARGEIILSLDNDIVCPDRDLVQKAVAMFRQFPDVGMMGCKIGTEDDPESPIVDHWWHPVPLRAGRDRCFYSDYFSEGAVFLRRSVLEAIGGGYDEDFWWGFESVDFAFRVLAAGFGILFCPNLVTAELRVRGFSPHRRAIVNYYTFRNKFWTVWKHYPFWRGVGYISPRIVTSFLRAVRAGWLDYFARGIFDGIFAPAVIRKKRRPLKPEIWRRIGKMRKGEFVAEVEIPSSTNEGLAQASSSANSGGTRCACS